LAIICFATGVLIGGRVQDKIGPRWVATTGGALVGLGLVLAGVIGNNPTGIAVCFGVITGLGIGFGYGSVLPAALKWFHPSKKGLVSGLILGGFGLASVHYALVTNALLSSQGIEKTLLYMGAVIIIVSVIIAQLVKNPPSDYVPPEPGNLPPSAASSVPVDFVWREMIQTRRFYFMFIIFLFSASMGLMIIGNVAKIASIQASVTDAAFLIILVAIMNALGRIIGGITSDKIGRVNTLFIVIILQMFNMIGFVYYQNLTTLIFGLVMVGLCFGAFLAIFPALTADQYGLKNYGGNYGIVYLAYGFAGVVAPLIADFFYDLNGNFNTTYMICAALMVVMVFVNYLLKRELDAL